MEIAILTENDGKQYFFGSLEGEYFLGIDREITLEDKKDLESLFEGNERTKPIQLHRSFIKRLIWKSVRGKVIQIGTIEFKKL